MRDSGIPMPVWFLLVLATVGILVPSTTGQNSPTTAKPAESAAVGTVPVPSTETTSPTDCDTRLDTVLEPTKSGSKRDAKGESATIYPLIALVPDPIDSGLYYDYDAVIDAASLTIEQDGWDRDRSWIPWNDPTAETDEDRERSIACRTTTPGMVLFRKQGEPAPGETDPPLDYLTVFVVGETPTTGIHRQAMEAALTRARNLRAKGMPKRWLPVLGPSFSGSAESLRVALLGWHAEQDPKEDLSWSGIDIVTGSATRQDIEKTLSTQDHVVPNLSCGIRFARTIPTDEETWNAFLCHFLANRDKRFDCAGSNANSNRSSAPMALVVESGTAYGRSLASGGPLVLQFPPHISTLRAAYNKQQGSVEVPKQARLKIAPPGLGASLDEIEAPRAVETNMSPKSTVAHDIVFGKLVERWIGSRVQYVGVGATDTADVIFVAHRIRQSSPDVRLFTLTHDSLLLHWAFSSDLDGMLVATAYPWLSAGTDHLIPMNSDISQGIHEATNQLLSPRGPDSHCACAARDPRCDCVCPPKYDDVWVGVIGHGTLWPLWHSSVLDPLQALPDSNPPDPKPWKFAFGILILASLYHLFAYGLSALEDRTPSGRALEKIRAFRHALHVPLSLRWAKSDHTQSFVSVEQGLFLAVMFSGLTVLVSVWSWVCSLAFRAAPSEKPSRTVLLTASALVSQPGLGNALLVFAGLLTALLLSCVSFHLWFRVFRLVSKAGSGFSAGAYGVLVAFLFAITAFVIFGTVSGLTVSEGMEPWMYERLTQLTNHVNPVIPATLLYVLLHLFYAGNLVRLRTAAVLHAQAALPHRLSPNPSLSEDHDSLPLGRLFRKVGVEATLVKKAEFDVCTAVAGSAADRISFVLSLCALSFIALMFVYVLLYVMPLTTVEGPWIDRLFAVLIPSCWLALSASLAWGLVFRARLRTLLRIVGTLPLAPAFSRLPASLSGPIPTILAAGPGRVKDLAPWVRRYEEIAVRATATNAASSLTPTPGAVGDQFAEETSQLFADTAALASQTFRLLIEGGSHIVECLRAQWVRSDPHQLPAWAAQAEEFVAALVVFVLREALQSFRAYFALLSGGSLLLGLAVASYVFEPQAALMSIVFVMLLLFVIAGVLVYISLDQDEVLSRLSGRDDPSKRGLNVAFLRWAFTWAIVPVMTAIFLRYPTIWTRISSWFGPIAGW